jgi:hypothetical protein
MMPKNITDPMMIQAPPMSFDRPEIGVSAMPAVDSAAIPQYMASPRDRIGLPSTPLSAANMAAEKINQSTLSTLTICRNSVRSIMSLMNL